MFHCMMDYHGWRFVDCNGRYCWQRDGLTVLHKYTAMAYYMTGRLPWWVL